MEFIFLVVSNYDDSLIYKLSILSSSIYNIIFTSFKKKIENDYKIGETKYRIAFDIITKYNFSPDINFSIDKYILKLFANRIIIFSTYIEISENEQYNSELNDAYYDLRDYIIIYITEDKQIIKKMYSNCKCPLKIIDNKLIFTNFYDGNYKSEDTNFNPYEISLIKYGLNNFTYETCLQLI